MRELPTYKGYTVDHRLGEFRRFVPGEIPEIIDFESDRGQELLAEMTEEEACS